VNAIVLNTSFKLVAFQIIFGVIVQRSPSMKPLLMDLTSPEVALLKDLDDVLAVSDPTRGATTGGFDEAALVETADSVRPDQRCNDRGA
jgi:hypothetical protein